MNFLSLAFPEIANTWQYLIVIIGFATALYLVGTEQYGHYLYWKKWRKSWLSFFEILPKKKKSSLLLKSNSQKNSRSRKYGILFLKICILIILGTCVGTLSSFFWGIIGFLFFGITGYVLEIVQKSNRKKEIIAELPLFLQTLGNALQAGYSFENALAFLVNEVGDPLKNEIEIINQKIKLHISVPEALSDFAKTVDHPDVNFFVESTNIQLKTGGNLIELFRKVTGLLEEKNELQRNIKSFTAQGKMSGVLIAILWPVSLFLFAILSPQHTQTLFYTTQGHFMLVLSFCLEALGFFFIWKIIRVKL